jgi:thiol-disulfide isomerase/thioredoxin
MRQAARTMALGAALLVGALTNSAPAGASKGIAPALGPADLPALASDEGHLSPGAITGRITLVNFWATWCAACRTELPSLDRLATKRPDLLIIAASVDDDRNEARRVFAKHYPHLKLAFASLPEVQRFGALGMPYSVVLGRDGREAARVPRALAWDGAQAALILARAR